MTPMLSGSIRPLSKPFCVVAISALLLTGCSDDAQPSPTTSSQAGTGSTGEAPESGSPTTSEPTVNPNTAYGLDLPKGVELTALGTSLVLGETATVAWEPAKKTVGVIAVTVTRLRKGTLADFAGFTLDEQTKQSTPYYVDATVQNLGKSDLSGVPTPLYLVDGENVLVQASTFQSTFAPCAAKPLPEKFKPGKEAKVCLVYIAKDRGTLAAISFRPKQEYAPIQWTGKLTKPKPGKPGKPGEKG